MNRRSSRLCAVAFILARVVRDLACADSGLPVRECPSLATVSCEKAQCPVYLSNDCSICVSVRLSAAILPEGSPSAITDFTLAQFVSLSAQAQATSAEHLSLVEIAPCSGGPAFESRDQLIESISLLSSLAGDYSYERPLTMDEIRAPFSRGTFSFRYHQFVNIVGGFLIVKTDVSRVEVRSSSDKSVRPLTARVETHLQQSVALTDLSQSVGVRSAVLTSDPHLGANMTINGSVITLLCSTGNCVHALSNSLSPADVSALEINVRDAKRAKLLGAALRHAVSVAGRT